MEQIAELQQAVEEQRSSRRSALLMGGAALAGLALSRKASAQSTAVTDTDILNFALNLEFFGAQYYTYATTGAGLSAAGLTTASGSGTAGGAVTIKSNPKVPFTAGGPIQAFAMEAATEEQEHVKFLQSALNASGANAAVAMPNIDLLNSFQTLAGFDPFASEINFLLGAFIFEDVDVTAYLGAAPLLQSSTNLAAALGIHAVEAYHAGSIRTQIFEAANASTPATVTVTIGGNTQTIPITTASQLIADARASADGSNLNPPDDIGVGTDTSESLGAAASTGTASTIVDVNLNAGSKSPGRVIPRTTAQVLKIVYGTATGGGLFFPNGLNGNIK